MGKKQKIKIENPKPTFSEASLEVKKETPSVCEKLKGRVNEILGGRANDKTNTMSPCDPKGKRCLCSSEIGGNSTGQKVDLIVLIDTSGSVGTSARAISDAVTDAIKDAKKKCKPDLEITYLGVDGTWAGTVFSQSHRNYIFSLHGTIPLAADANHVGLKQEQGANAIEDLAKYAKWREGACRAIFYISDEELDSISPRNDFANETAVTNAAIASANAHDVTVFAHHLTYQNLAPQIIQNYKDLCDYTGGQCYFSNTPKKSEYVKLLTEVICKACGGCRKVKFPDLKPCISIKWGDSECDCIESSDYEVMTLTVCNCYQNVTFNNFKISMLEVLDSNGNPVPILPDGTPSVKLHPVGIYCFGNIAPCTCVSREFVLINEGAKAGKYKIVLKGICFDVIKAYAEKEDCFEFEICKD